MVIQHNILAHNANRQLGIVSGRKASFTEKLSSGYRINRSADDAATEDIDTISYAVGVINKLRSRIGAYQNRLEHTIKNESNIVENTTASESKIRDTDMASMMVEYSKAAILEQVGQSMLAQANQSTQGCLALLS